MAQQATSQQATSRKTKEQSQGEVIKSRLWLFACYQMLFHLDNLHLIQLREEQETITVKSVERNIIKYTIQPTSNLKYKLKLANPKWYEKAFCLENSMKEVSSVYESHGFRDMQMMFTNNIQKISEDFNTSFDNLCLSFEKDLLWLEKYAKEHNDKLIKSELVKSQRYFKVVMAVFTIIIKGYHLNLNEDLEFLSLLNNFFTKKIIYNKRLTTTTRVMNELRPLVSYVFTKAVKEFESLKEAYELNAFDSDIIGEILGDTEKMSNLDKEIYLRIDGKFRVMRLEDALVEIAFRMNSSKYEELVKVEICEQHIALVKSYTDTWNLNDIFLNNYDIKHLSILQESKEITNSTSFKKYILHQPKLLLFFTSHFAIDSEFVSRQLYKNLVATTRDDKKYNTYFSYIYSNLTKQILMLRLAAIHEQFNIFSNGITLIQLNEYNAFANYIRGGCHKLDLRVYSALRFGNFDKLIDEALKNFLIALQASNVQISSQANRILNNSYNAFIALKQEITDNL